MPCYYPVDGYRAALGGWTKNLRDSTGVPMQVPCGGCIGCRLELARQWGVRCMHEKRTSSESCFVTLTYDEDQIPSDWSLSTAVHQKFMRKIRKHAGPGVRFFLAGEYGTVCRICLKSRKLCKCGGYADKSNRIPGRPHYHACLFNIDFPDKKFFKMRGEHRLYTSATLERLWPYGFSSLGALTFGSACYVGQYCTKKKNGRLAGSHYLFPDRLTGEIISRKPEYAVMSRNPGIGAEWYARYSQEVWARDSVISNGKEAPPPRYYLKLLEKEDKKNGTKRAEAVKKKRQSARLGNRWNNTRERLAVREEVRRAMLKERKGPDV